MKQSINELAVNKIVYQTRLKKLQKKLGQGEAYILANEANISYFTGHRIFLIPQEREGFLVVTSTQIYLIIPQTTPFTNSNFIHYLFGCQPHQLAQHLNVIQKEEKLQAVFVDFNQFTLAENEAIKNLSPDLNVKNLNQRIIWYLREIKDISEQKLLQKSAQIASNTITNIMRRLEVGQTKIELANLINYQLAKAGAKPAFPTIVAFGVGSALPHYQPQKVKLEVEMPILIDMGADYQGYKSDLTRTFWFGKNPTQTFQDRYSLVKKAYTKTLQALNQALQKQVVIKAKDLDQVARKTIARAGFADKFIHTTGHGLGLSIHEPPSISFKNNALIKPNMVITIEPGVYFPNEFGIRLENTILVEKRQAIELTSASN